jgi:dienelactone hydrolase
VGATDSQRLPDAPRYLLDVTPQTKTQMQSVPLPSDSIGKVFQGELVVPFALTGPGGTLRPELLRFDRIPFLLTLPTSAAPAMGYPVTLFGHGLAGDHQHMLALANTLASSGRAVIAIDTVKHGERSTCGGSAVVFQSQSPTATDDMACADPVRQRCDDEPASPTFGRCIARPGVQRSTCAASQPDADLTCAAKGEGRCLDTDPTGDNDQCEGGTFRKNPDGSVAISGWNMLDLRNLFVTRDNFRQQVIDLAQVVRVLKSEGIDAQLVAQGAAPLDGNSIDYVGQSLGSMLGTLYGAVSPDAHHLVLNVPGGRFTQILDESTDDTFVAMRTRFYSTLAAAQMPQGSPAFDTFMRTAQWIVDPADPINYSWHVSNGAGVPANRKALVQYITGDMLFPNSTTLALIDAANTRGGGSQLMSVSRFAPTSQELPAEDRHGFMTNGKNPAVTQQAQDDVVKFLNDKQ